MKRFVWADVCLPARSIISNTEWYPYVWSAWEEKVNAQKTISADTVIRALSISVQWGALTTACLVAYIEQKLYPAVGKGWCLNQEWCENGLLGFFPLLKILVSNRGRVLTEKTACCPFLLLSLLKCPHNDLFPFLLVCSLTFPFPCFFQCSDLPGTNFPQRQVQSATQLISSFVFLVETIPFTITFCFLCLKRPCGTFSSGKPCTSIPQCFCRDGSAPGPTGTQGQGKTQSSPRSAWPHILWWYVYWEQGVMSGGGKLPFPLGSELKEQQEQPDLAQN